MPADSPYQPYQQYWAPLRRSGQDGAWAVAGLLPAALNLKEWRALVMMRAAVRRHQKRYTEWP